MTKLEYGAQVKSIQLTIKNISDLGVDVTRFMENLNTIKEKISSDLLDIKSNDNINDAEKNDLISKAYDSSFEDLKVLLDYLSKYDIYSQTINKSQYLFKSQDEVNYSKIDISNSIDELIVCLDSIESFNGLNDEEDDMLIDSLYKVVYNLIKIEYKSNGSSKLLEYCKKSRANSIYVNGYILEDIESLRKSNFDTHDIDLLIYKIKSSGKENTYLDEELMRLISICTDKDNYVKDLVDSLQLIVKNLEKHNSTVDTLKRDKSYLESRQNDCNRDLKRYRTHKTKTIIRDIISTVLSIAYVTGAVYLIPKVAREKTYNTDTETYSTTEGYDLKKDEYLESIAYNGSSVDNYTKIVIYEPWEEQKFLGDKSYKREVKVLYLTDVELESIQDYATFDAEALGYEFDVDEEEKDELVPEDVYSTPITEVTKISQDIEDMKISEEPDSDNIIMATFASCAAFAIIWMIVVLGCNSTFGIITSLKDLIDALKNPGYVDEDKKNLREIVAKLKAINEEFEALKQKPASFESDYNKIMNVPENEKLLLQFRKGIDLLDKYANEIEMSKKLTL